MNVGDTNGPNRTSATKAQLAAQNGQRAYEKAKKEGVGGYAIDFWDGAAKHADADVKSGKSWWITGNARWAGAKVMGFFARMSGADEVEGRFAQNRVLWKDDGASAGEKVKAGAWMTFESAMALLNFTGLGGIAKGALRRQAARVVAKEGAEIAARFAAKEGAETAARLGAKELAAAGLGKAVKGMLPATAEAAALVRQELAAVVAKLPAAGKLGAAELEALQEGLVAVGRQHGVEVVFKAGAPQVLTEAGKITVYGSGAAWHETLHVVQTVQTQATAMQSMAQRLGKAVSELSAKEMKDAYTATVKTIETQGYKHFEEHAFQGVGTWGSKLDPAKYAKALEDGLGAFERALVTGTAPNVAPGLGARIYGAMTGLGESQGEIAANFSPIWAGIVTRIRRAFEPAR
jgi:hypothetical protein